MNSPFHMLGWFVALSLCSLLVVLVVVPQYLPAYYSPSLTVNCPSMSPQICMALLFTIHEALAKH